MCVKKSSSSSNFIEQLMQKILIEFSIKQKWAGHNTNKLYMWHGRSACNLILVNNILLLLASFCSKSSSINFCPVLQLIANTRWWFRLCFKNLLLPRLAFSLEWSFPPYRKVKDGNECIISKQGFQTLRVANSLNKTCLLNLFYGISQGLILHVGNEGDCCHAPWSLPWCPCNTPVESYNFLIGMPFSKEKIPWCPCFVLKLTKLTILRSVLNHEQTQTWHDTILQFFFYTFFFHQGPISWSCFCASMLYEIVPWYVTNLCMTPFSASRHHAISVKTSAQELLHHLEENIRSVDKKSLENKHFGSHQWDTFER